MGYKIKGTSAEHIPVVLNHRDFLLTENPFLLSVIPCNVNTTLPLSHQTKTIYKPPFMKTKNILSVIVTVIAFFSTSCKKENIMDAKLQADGEIAGIGEFINTPPKTFDPLLMAQKIEAYMNGKVAGYGYTIMHEGKPWFLNQGGAGWARYRIDAPNYAFRHGYQSRQGIANAAKFVTALATISLLEKYGLSLDEKIYPYLPTNWKPSYEFKQLSFRRLLEHRTGLINYGKNLADYKKTVEDGVDLFLFEDGCRIYNDVNYGLAGILLPYLKAKKSNATDYANLKALQTQPLELEETLIYRFLGIAATTVFKPTGFSYWNNVNYTPWDNNGFISTYESSAGYPTKDGSVPGIPKWDERKVAPARGLYISAWEFTQIQYAAAQFKIVSKAGYETMRTQLLGFDGAVVGAHGKYTWKKGSGDNLESMIFDFGKTQVAVFANSMHSHISDDPTILADAFDESWK